MLLQKTFTYYYCLSSPNSRYHVLTITINTIPYPSLLTLLTVTVTLTTPWTLAVTGGIIRKRLLQDRLTVIVSLGLPVHVKLEVAVNRRSYKRRRVQVQT